MIKQFNDYNETIITITITKFLRLKLAKLIAINNYDETITTECRALDEMERVAMATWPLIKYNG